jgi:hypothetical protein
MPETARTAHGLPVPPRLVARHDPLIALRLIYVRRATEKVLNQLGIPGQDAFARLRVHAFAEHRPLDDVARDVLEGRLQFTEDMN